MSSYRCPDGTVVSDQVQYLKSWDNIIKPFEKELDMVCTGFDPSISFRPNDNWNYSIQLPVDFVINVNNKIKDLKNIKE